MSDLIDRQKLREDMYHEAFEVDSDFQKWDGGCWIRYKMFENIIDKQPSAQPGRYKWNPIKDGLPDEEGVYFVTDDAGGMATVCLDVFSHYEDGSPYWLYSQNVTAWMHTPEPYKEDKDA